MAKPTNVIGLVPRGMPAKRAKDAPFTGDPLEGANHVLRGLHQQLQFWQALEGHDEDQALMVPALTKAAAALREGLKSVKTRAEG